MRNWPKCYIEIGGRPPSRKPYAYSPPFFLDWFGGMTIRGDSSRFSCRF